MCGAARTNEYLVLAVFFAGSALNGQLAPVIELATTLRAAQFAAHTWHTRVAGRTFMQDHEFLGELYEAYEGAYDRVVERLVGLGKTPDLQQVTLDAATLHSKILAIKKDWPEVFLEVEKAIRHDADAALLQKQSNGTQNFLQGLCDESEQRTYKLGQRAKS